MTDDESHKGDVVYEHLQRFIRAGRTDDIDKLMAVAERIEVDLLLGDLPAPQRQFLRAGLYYINHMLRERGHAPKYNVLRELGDALKDET